MKLPQKSLNNINKISSIFLLLTFLFSAAYAGPGNNDKAISKARAAIEKASLDDWETYAKSAEMCISKNVNMKEASKWLDHSIAIKATTYNLRVKGDYYLKNKLPRKAMEQYLKAIDIGKAKDNNYDMSDLQNRIGKARKLQKKLM